MQMRGIRKMCRRLANWSWAEESFYKTVKGAEGHEAALNLLWAMKGRPHRIAQKHLDADFGIARTLVEKKIQGRAIEDYILTQSPEDFWMTVQQHAEVFTKYKPLSFWRNCLNPQGAICG